MEHLFVWDVIPNKCSCFG